MKTQKLLVALTAAKAALLMFSVTHQRGTRAQDVTAVIRGHALEIIDEHERVSALRSKCARHSLNFNW